MDNAGRADNLAGRVFRRLNQRTVGRHFSLPSVGADDCRRRFILSDSFLLTFFAQQ
jgi:hypothetical protein